MIPGVTARTSPHFDDVVVVQTGAAYMHLQEDQARALAGEILDALNQLDKRRELHRDEARVRAEAEVREGL
ncbi:hypothetical protein [Rhodococcus sp. NPDC058521]|uniref:hypothetical protein n=1 Tax=Rhodococcus sp. NPDC058521 TaxID=3346536 RepID=UPI00365B786D